MTENSRKPQSFDLSALGEAAPADTPDEPPSAIKKPAAARKPRAASPQAIIRDIPDDAAQRIEISEAGLETEVAALTPPPPPKPRRRFSFAKVLFAALAGLVSLAVGLAIDQLIRDLFSRSDWLGWLAATLSIIVVIALLAIVIREAWGLRNIAKIEALREEAATAHAEDDAPKARGVLGELVALYESRPETARGRTALAAHEGEIIDGRDLIELAERDLLTDLDVRARGLVMASAKRVSVVTAVSPRALIDLAYVLMENMKLIRQMADLYGGRPGTLGFFRLARNVLSHLAVTGSIAIGDGLIQQVVGHGLAARLSSRLGEGVVNGLLTARIGIAAIDVCRPLPFLSRKRPSVGDFLIDLTTLSGLKKPGETKS